MSGGSVVEFEDLGTMPYGECWALQQRLFEQLLHDKVEGNPRCGHILMVEHPAVYTLGKSGKSGNMLLSAEQLEAIGASYYHIDRGGDVTFHGSGQIVLYPILDLEQVGIGLKEYIHSLEEAVIKTIAHWGIEATRSKGAAGVWIEKGGEPERGSELRGGSEPKGGSELEGGGSELRGGSKPENERRGAQRNKICAIGVKSSRYITMHGLAMNVETDLKFFDYINPCGFTDRGVTSMERELGSKIPLAEVKELLLDNLTKILNVKIYKK